MDNFVKKSLLLTSCSEDEEGGLKNLSENCRVVCVYITYTGGLSLPTSAKRKVLFIGNDQFLRGWYLNAFKDGGYVAEGITLSELETNLAPFAAEVIVLDLPHKEEPIRYLKQIFLIWPSIPVVLSIEMEDSSCAGEALRFGAADLLFKPIEPQLLMMILHRTLEKDRLLKENKELRNYIDLYSACQRITSQLETEGVRTATLTALVSETRARVAFYLDWPHTNGPKKEKILDQKSGEYERFLDELIPQIAQHETEAEAYTIDLDYSELKFKNLREEGYAEVLIVPLRDHESVVGIFVLMRHKTDNPWSARVMGAVKFIAQHAALAWHNVTLYAKAKELAFQDLLTGLYNARYLPLAIEREIALCKESGDPFAILFLDLDYFRRVNDLYGHQVGSQLLAEVSRVIRHCVRDQDIVVRYGGDEFTIVLKGTNLATAEQIAERMRMLLARHTFLSREGLNVTVTLCIGVSAYPVHAGSTEELIFLADRAMYKGKNSSRNQVNIADPKDLIGQKITLPEY
jgi:diguanylate cyclase (GGDEF)-like protein